MLTTIYSPKGGSGTTTVAASFALTESTPVTLVDAAEHGDLPAILGLPNTYFDGFAEWSWATGDPVELFRRLTHAAMPNLDLVHRGADKINARVLPQMQAVVEHTHIIMDCGMNGDLANLGHRRLMVLRADYIALKRALNFGTSPTGIILVQEPERSLTARDVEDVLGVQVLTAIPFDPVISRTLDAGILAARQPKILRDALERVRQLT